MSKEQAKADSRVNYEVQVLKMGEQDVPGPEVYWMSNWWDWETLYFYMVVIRGGDKVVVINTGPPSDLTFLNSLWKEYAGERCMLKRTEDERPENALKRIGVDPRKVDYVLITPMVAYANANIALFPNAKICFSRKGWIEDCIAPKYPKHIPRQVFVPDDVLIHLLTEAWERVHLLEEEEEILPGIKTFWTGVHHRSSIAICIETVRGTVVVSDCFFKYGNIEQNKPLGVGESLEECWYAYKRLREEGNILIPLYDPEVMQRYPEGKIA